MKKSKMRGSITLSLVFALTVLSLSAAIFMFAEVKPVTRSDKMFYMYAADCMADICALDVSEKICGTELSAPVNPLLDGTVYYSEIMSEFPSADTVLTSDELTLLASSFIADSRILNSLTYSIAKTKMTAEVSADKPTLNFMLSINAENDTLSVDDVGITILIKTKNMQIEKRYILKNLSVRFSEDGARITAEMSDGELVCTESAYR